MDELKKLREKINEIDKELVSLFEKRMELADFVYESKAKTGAPILNEEREAEVIKNSVNLVPGELKSSTASLMQHLMRTSRSRQYKKQLEDDSEFLSDVIKVDFNAKSVVYCGSESSYSALASNFLFPGVKNTGLKSFLEAMDNVREGKADVAVVPIENSTAGTINEVYDALTQKKLFIVKSLSLNIEHTLLGIKGAKLSDIKTVMSHPQALSQCSSFISEQGFKTVPSDNTAFAARDVSSLNDKTIGVIASKNNSGAYGLEILKENISNVSCNQTRFVALANKMYLAPTSNKTSIAFTVKHKSGALVDALSLFADLNLNLTKIQSRPLAHKPWEYMFYLDFEGSIFSDNAKLAIYQLSKETSDFYLLGCYNEYKTVKESI